MNKFNKISKFYGLMKRFLSGHPSWPFLMIKNFSDTNQRSIKTYFMQSMPFKTLTFLEVIILMPPIILRT